uniref:Uncharacterized protein n=1 Tax=Avena sativa TaxID=4498 RepID=A0ACD5WHZ8_AVESA
MHHNKMMKQRGRRIQISMKILVAQMIMSTSPCGAGHDNVAEEDVAPVLQGSSPSRDPISDTIEEEGDDDKEIEMLKRQLTREFEVKDLGQLRFFLGIEVSRSAIVIYLSQRKYILDLLAETGMIGCRPVSTPIEPNLHLVKDGGFPVDRGEYQRLVGRLIYLSHTRPDIAFAVSLVSQFMHNPQNHHLDAVKRILRYLKGCPGKGLLYTSNGNLQVECYTDADWAGSLDDRRSTSGYCTFVGGNLVT